MSAKRRSRGYVLPLLLLYVSFGLVYWWVTPIYEGPDEPMHYAYVRHLVETRRLPPHAGYGGDHPAQQETSQPPLYYTSAALLTFWAPDHGDYAGLLDRNPHFAYPAPPTVADNKNTWLHTAGEKFPWRGTVLAIRVTRLVSLLFGVLGVLAVWGLGREIWPNCPLVSLTAAGLAAFVPQFLFISTVVSNDSAAMALSACILWAVVWGARVNFTRSTGAGGVLGTACLLGLLMGLGALTKVSVLGLLPLVGLYLVVCAVRQRAPWQAAARMIVVAYGVAALVSGWWYARNLVLHGDPVNIRIHVDSPWAWEAPRSLWSALGQLGGVERSFWGVFGAGNIGLHDAVYTLLRLGWILALAGWALRLRRRGDRRSQGRVWAILWIWLLLIMALQVRWMQLVLAPWGRLLFPALPAIACIFVAGWLELAMIFNRRPSWLPLVPVAGLCLLSGLAPWLVIRPAYARPPQLTMEAVAERSKPLDIQLGELVRLVGYEVERASVPPDGWFNVTLCWEALQTAKTDHTVFVQLIGPDGGLAASRHTYHGQGRLPATRWRPGDRFCDETRVHVEAHVRVPAAYHVEVGLLDESGARLPASSGGGALEGPLFLTRVRVGPENPPVVEITYPLDFRLGESIRLRGVGGLPESVGPGETLSLILYWVADVSSDEDTITFVHLVAPDGRVVAQVDRQPRDGAYPTSFWLPGETVSDTVALLLPADAAPGTYRLVGGMYTWPAIQRLPVRNEAGETLPDGLIPLGSIAVR